jgi:site-specific recombinase XerD
MTTTEFRSVLGPAMRQLLTLRHSLGYSDKTLATLFASFDRYFFARAGTDPWLKRDIVEAWVASKPQLKPVARAHRYSALRLLGRFLADQYPQTYVPGPRPGLKSTFRPHIYTPVQIRALLDEAARLRPLGSLRPRTYVTLIGLLYCSGLRVSEALALRLADVDLDEELLIIRNAKFHKSRAVPLQRDVRHALAAYLKSRHQYRHRTDPDAMLFVNEWHRPCSYGTVAATFLEIARRAGIRGAPPQRGPRLHDLRHTFAVHRLLAWYRDGGDVQARLPLLSTYLGHVSLISTQIYLNVTAELLHEAASRFRAPALPGVAGDLS